MTSGDYYFKVRSYIFDLELSEKEIIVHMYLCSCSNKENVLSIVKTNSSISQRSVKDAIKVLIDISLIIKDNQNRTPTMVNIEPPPWSPENHP